MVKEMARQLMKVDVPKNWIIRRNAGLCPVCGKDPSEFEKGMRVYCSVRCREEYAKCYCHWNDIRERIFKRDGRKCAKCGITNNKIHQDLIKKKKELMKKFVEEKKELIEYLRNKKLNELSERYEKDYKNIMKDDLEFIEDNKWSIDEEILKKHGIYFSQFIEREMSFEIDHIKAIVNGGDEWDEKNLQVLCEKCHKEKTKRDMLERKRNKIKTKELNTLKLVEGVVKEKC